MEGSSKFPAFGDAEPQIDHEARPPSRESVDPMCPEPTTLDAPVVDTFEFHPLANIFPLLEDDEFDDLVEDIRLNGLREPIVLTPDGRILDGRNRYLACRAVKLNPWLETTEELPENWPSFVISKNIRRRHLTPSQLATVAVELVIGMSDDRDPAKPANLPGRSSQVDAATRLGVSERHVRDAVRVKRASKELFQLVKAGKVAVDVAAKTVRHEREYVAKFVEEVKAGETPANAKRKIATAKEPNPVDEPVRVNDADTGKKANANPAPSHAEEYADILLARFKREEIPMLISLIEAARPDDVIVALRRKNGRKSHPVEGVAPIAEKRPVKRSQTKPAMTEGTGTKALQRELSVKLDQFLASDEPAAKDKELIQELRKAIKAVNGVEGPVSYALGLGTEMITFKGEPRALGLVAEEVFRAIVDSVKAGMEMKPAEPSLGESTMSVRGNRRGMKKTDKAV